MTNNKHDDNLQDEQKDTKNLSVTDLIRKFDHLLEASPFKGVFKEMDAFVNRSILQQFPINIYETDKEIIITAELPGVNRENIYIDVDGTFLTIGVNNKSEVLDVDTEGNYHRREISTSHSERTVRLPQGINEKEAKAIYQNGVLELRAPKRPAGMSNITIE